MRTVLVQLLKYYVVGGIAFVVDYGSLYVQTDFCGVHYLLSAAIAFTLGLICNYCLSTKWVFDQGRVNNKFAEFAIFALIGVVGLGLNELIIYFGTSSPGSIAFSNLRAYESRYRRSRSCRSHRCI